MATAERKARKAQGIKHPKFDPATAIQKVGTPIQERSWFTALVFDAKNPLGRPRSVNKRAKALAARGLVYSPKSETVVSA